jgi:large conductance mechanosensitive channel
MASSSENAQKLKATKKNAQGLWTEFKAFISRGSVIDLAVGMVVGAAFTSIVNSLVNDVVAPVLGLIIGGINFSDLKLVLVPAAGDTAEVAIAYGNFINAVINFLAISAVVFLAVKLITKIRTRLTKEAAEKPAEEPKVSPEVELLTQIRDELKAQNAR